MFRTYVRVLLILLTLMQMPGLAFGQGDDVSRPGYVDYPMSLSLFASPALVPACEMLQKGDLAGAEKVFAAEINQNPDNLTAQLGYLQAARTRRSYWLAEFRKAAETHPTAANHFRLGVLAWYKVAALSLSSSQSAVTEREFLAKLALSELQSAYDLTHAPVVGFTLGHAGPFLRHSNLGYYIDMLKRIGGEDVYAAYMRAQQHDWMTEQPPIPHLTRENLRILQQVVHVLWRKNSGRWAITKTHMVNGKSVVEVKGYNPYTPQQERARAYLSKWEATLKAAADAAPAQHVSAASNR